MFPSVLIDKRRLFKALSPLPVGIECPGFWPVTLAFTSLCALLQRRLAHPSHAAPFWKENDFIPGAFFVYFVCLLSTKYCVRCCAWDKFLNCARQPIWELIWGWEFSKFLERACGRQWEGKRWRPCYHDRAAWCSGLPGEYWVVAVFGV